MTGVENVGGLISGNNQKITYTAFDKVATISEKVASDQMQLTITYGPDEQRWKTSLKKNNELQKTIIFAPDYEQITSTQVKTQLYYIGGSDGL